MAGKRIRSAIHVWPARRFWLLAARPSSLDFCCLAAAEPRHLQRPVRVHLLTR